MKIERMTLGSGMSGFRMGSAREVLIWNINSGQRVRFCDNCLVLGDEGNVRRGRDGQRGSLLDVGFEGLR